MQNIKEQALLATCTYKSTIPLWLCYVDDTFAAVNKEVIYNFHEHVNKQIVDVQFIKEIQEYGKILLVDCLGTHKNNRLRTTMYRKPTHTNRLLA